MDGDAGLCFAGRQIAKTDILVEGGRWASAGDPTCRFTVNPNFITVAADAALLHFESNKATREAGGLDSFERGAPDEIAFIHFHDPAETGFQWIDGGGEFV